MLVGHSVRVFRFTENSIRFLISCALCPHWERGPVNGLEPFSDCVPVLLTNHSTATYVRIAVCPLNGIAAPIRRGHGMPSPSHQANVVCSLRMPSFRFLSPPSPLSRDRATLCDNRGTDLLWLSEVRQLCVRPNPRFTLGFASCVIRLPLQLLLYLEYIVSLNGEHGFITVFFLLYAVAEFLTAVNRSSQAFRAIR